MNPKKDKRKGIDKEATDGDEKEDMEEEVVPVRFLSSFVFIFALLFLKEFPGLFT